MSDTGLEKYECDEFTRKRLEKALAGNNATGGNIEINYKESHVIAPLAHLFQALTSIENYSYMERISVMKSVNKYLRKNYQKSLSGQATQQKAMNVCQDITIWYANEIFEGRAKLP